MRESNVRRAVPDGDLQKTLTEALERGEGVLSPLLDAVRLEIAARRVTLYRSIDGRTLALVASAGTRHDSRCGEVGEDDIAARALRGPQDDWIVDTTGDEWSGAAGFVNEDGTRGVLVCSGAGGIAAAPATATRSRLVAALRAALALDALCPASSPPALPPAASDTTSSTDAPLDVFPLVGEPLELSPAFLRSEFPDLLGDSVAMRSVVVSVMNAAQSDLPVLVEGESGTGKELVAQAIHRTSQRGHASFVSENCGALPENLVEAELFGHVRGAFTGATEDKPGLFERAHGGTVFLDEIGEMDLTVQKRLLRVLQEKEIRRVGGQKLIRVDFRVIAATNKLLEHEVASGEFREDLYYRLNVISIRVPPLRERDDDVIVLIEHFNHEFATDSGRAPLEFTGDALEVLKAYSWPGNVRELRNEIQRLSACSSRRVGIDQVSRRIVRQVEESARWSPGRKRRLPELEREILGSAVLAALRESRGNRTEAARQLGITRSSLYRRIKRYGLEARLRAERL